jgi:AAA domain-containing protein/DnaB helicase-like protein
MTAHNLAAEEAILGCVLDHPASLRQLRLGADHFIERHRLILQALHAAVDLHGEPNLLMVDAELIKRDASTKVGGLPALMQLRKFACLPQQLDWHARAVEFAAMQRVAEEIAHRVIQMAHSATDPDDLQFNLASQAIELTKLADDGLTSDIPLTSLSLLEDFVNEDIEPYNWVIPGILEHGERFVLTAPEGVGKSVLARQVATLVAAGRHPLIPKVSIPRKRSLIVDLENPPNLIRRHARSQVQAVTAGGLDLGDRCYIWREPGGLDIRREGMRQFERVLDQVRPDIVCLGPVYKLTSRQGAHDGFEEQAAGIQHQIDQLVKRYGCAFWLEHHAGKSKDANGKRSTDPYGSSFWLRWSEFGYGMARAEGCTDGSMWALENFRGDRDARMWPDTLLRTGNPGAPWGADWSDPERKAAIFRLCEGL